MKTALAAALGAALLLSTGCSLTIDPDGVKPPEEQQPPPVRGACIDAAGGHKLCGGELSGGASPQVSAPGGHAVGRGSVAAAAAPTISNSQHGISRGVVSP